jgi:superfamily II DNA or RNA helicase
MAMVGVALGDVDVGVVEDVVGSRAFQRGVAYVRQNRVLRLRWDDADDTLVAKVIGPGGLYETEAYFDGDHDGYRTFLEGECSCPVGVNCKHVAAIVVAAVEAGEPAPAPLTPRRPTRARGVRPPAWEESLQALLPAPSSGPGKDTTPLAIQLTLAPSAEPGSPTGRQLTATIVRPGRNGWVNGGLSWSGLDSWQVEHGHYLPDHLAVLRELSALHVARPRGRHVTSYYSAYSGSADKVIDLAGLGRSLWALLDEARAVGLRLVPATPGLDDVELGRQAELCLDVTRDAGEAGLVVAPVLRVGGAQADADAHVVPVGFVGVTGHGVVYAAREDVEADADPTTWRLGLAPLATPAAAPLRQLVRSGRRVEVPASGRATFAEEIWPGLRHVASVTSSDGSFTPPEISPPRLVIQASYGIGHALDLALEWAYDVGSSERRCPVDAGGGVAGAAGAPPAHPAHLGYRDPAAERSLLASFAALDLGLERFGLVTAAGPVPRVQLTGIETMRFTTEVLPLLDDEPDVVVEVTGHPADFREVTDSLVIGLSTDQIAGETDWFDLGVSLTVDGRELPFAGVFLALANGESDLLLPDGAYLSLEKPELRALRGLIEEARALHDHPGEPGDALRISRYQAGFWDELRQLGVVTRQAEAWERQVDALLALGSPDAPAGLDAIDVPEGVTAELRPYQRDGFQWLGFLWRHRLGGILADDMGLGKTLQTLALICHARDSQPFLIVAPTSVVPNWVSEAARFVPSLSVVAVTDTLKRSGRTIDEVVRGADIVVTSYTLFRLDADAYNSRDWAGLVLDEAQATKNHNSKVYGCIRRSPAPFKLAITGTPMENNLMELWSLLSITAPGLFPSPARFADRYARPIERRGEVERLAQLRRRIRPLMKRRTKELVAADLPAKQEQVLEVELHPRHRKIYDTHLQRERQKVLGLIDDLDRNRLTILRSLTLLRQLCLHPALVEGAMPATKAAAPPCVKLDTLVQQLDEVVAGGHRALVFSQFTGFLGLVRERLDREGIGYCYLDGRTRDRAAVLRRFKEGTDPVFVISLKAGGFGLNLTEADYCFLLDPWWNPATEAQAVDRTHRIGQTRNVMAYRLIASGTIEEKVMALKERKAQLFTGLMDDGDLFSTALDADDIRALFTS